MTHWRLRQGLVFFSNKFFFAIKYFLTKVSTLFRYDAISHLIDYSINVTFLYNGKPKNICGSVDWDSCFIVLVWNWTCPISKVCLYIFFSSAYDTFNKVDHKINLSKLKMVEILHRVCVLTSDNWKLNTLLNNLYRSKKITQRKFKNISNK